MAAAIMAAAATGMDILMESSIAGDAAVVVGSWGVRDMVMAPLRFNSWKLERTKQEHIPAVEKVQRLNGCPASPS